MTDPTLLHLASLPGAPPYADLCAGLRAYRRRREGHAVPVTDALRFVEGALMEASMRAAMGPLPSILASLSPTPTTPAHRISAIGRPVGTPQETTR